MVYSADMSYAFYKALHLSALFATALALGGLWLFYALPLKEREREKSLRIFLLNIHGFSLFIAFTAGFALIAKLQITLPYPFWLYIKMGIFLVLGAAPFFLKARSRAAASSNANAAAYKQAWLLISFALLFSLFILSACLALFK